MFPPVSAGGGSIRSVVAAPCRIKFMLNDVASPLVGANQRAASGTHGSLAEKYRKATPQTLYGVA